MPGQILITIRYLRSIVAHGFSLRPLSSASQGFSRASAWGSRRLAIEVLEGRVLLAVGDLRLVTYNVASTDGTPSVDLGTILSAIGSELVAGRSRPIDVLAIQEVDTQVTTTAGVVSQMNAIYGANTYSRGAVNGASTNTFTGDTVGLVFNTQTVSLVSELAIGTVSSAGQPRQTIRYQLRPLGVSPVTDFYLYNSHFKSSDTTEAAARRQVEALAVRANADSLPQGTHIIYAGDFNLYTSGEAAFQTLIGAGNGQAFDPINRIGSWSDNNLFLDVFTQAPAIVGPGPLADGGLDDRFDFLLQSNEWTDGASLEYVPGSYHAFGNNGSVPINGNINDPSSTALPGILNRTTLLNLLTSVTDHLPVVADLRFIPSVVEQFVSYLGGTYSQSFDGLPSTGTFILPDNGPHFLDGSIIASQNLAGWEFANVGGSSNSANFSFGTGSSISGSIYSFGAPNAPERALGTVAAASMIGWFGVTLINNTRKTLTSFSLSYVGEKWREGGSNTPDTLSFSYGLGVQNIISPGSGLFTDFMPLDFVSPTTSTTGGAANGNLTANQSNESATVNGIQWLAGQRLVLRWKDVNDAGSDDGLAIDNLTFSAKAAEVLARRIYYRDTAYDTNSSSESAIDSSKVPLIAGAATAANYSGFSRGLTGVIVDVRDLSSNSLTAADFQFRTGNINSPASWPILPLSSLLATNPILVLPGLGSSGSTRVKVNFEDNAIRNQWLQVTLKSNANTGLAASDVFYFGSLPGDVVNTGNQIEVDYVDIAQVRRNAPSTSLLASKAEDLNKDGQVNAIDVSLARQQSLSGSRLSPLNVNPAIRIGLTGISTSSAWTSNATIFVVKPNFEIVQSDSTTAHALLSDDLSKKIDQFINAPRTNPSINAPKPSRSLYAVVAFNSKAVDKFFSEFE